MLLPKVSVVLSDACSIGSALARRLVTAIPDSQVRCSPVLDSWDGLSDVCSGADVVYLLSALDLRHPPADHAALQEFKSGVTRVLECCQECGVRNLVFTSSASVVANDNDSQGLDLADENRPFVSEREDPTAHAIAMAEAEVLKASGTQNLAGSSCLYTCALRPATIYGTEDDRSLQRALSWVGYGLNRLAVGPRDVLIDMVYAENLVEAQVLAGSKLMEGASDGKGADWGTREPVSSGQAYFVTDGEPRNPHAFMDDICDGLDFSTSKILRLPTIVAQLMAWVAEVVCKAGLATTPFLSRAEVKTLTTSRTYSIDRARRDLGYERVVDPDTAARSTVEFLRQDGWQRHTVLVPALGYWICIPLGIWLVTLAGFGGPAPKVFAPLVAGAENVGLLIFRSITVIQAVCWAAYLVHFLEGVYAYRLAQKAGHKDTAPLWFLQSFILGFPSLILIRQLLS